MVDVEFVVQTETCVGLTLMRCLHSQRPKLLFRLVKFLCMLLWKDLFSSLYTGFSSSVRNCIIADRQTDGRTDRQDTDRDKKCTHQ